MQWLDITKAIYSLYIIVLVHVDIDECATDNGGCEQNCNNTDWVCYYCTCDMCLRAQKKTFDHGQSGLHCMQLFVQVNSMD